MALDPWYELRKYVSTGDYGAAKKLLAKDPSVISSTNSIGETVLHNLAVEDFSEGVKWLHSMGADLNARNRMGNPVVFEVALFEHKDLLGWMIEQKVDLGVKNNDGDDIWAYLKEAGSPKIAAYIKSLLPAEKGKKAQSK